MEIVDKMVTEGKKRGFFMYISGFAFRKVLLGLFKLFLFGIKCLRLVINQRHKFFNLRKMFLISFFKVYFLCVELGEFGLIRRYLLLPHVNGLR